MKDIEVGDKLVRVSYTGRDPLDTITQKAKVIKVTAFHIICAVVLDNTYRMKFDRITGFSEYGKEYGWLSPV